MPTLPPSTDALALVSGPRSASPSTASHFTVEPRRGPRLGVNAVVDNAGLTAALVTLARVFAPLVAAELREAPSAQDAEPWLDQTCSPLGRRLHCALARAGTLPARKMGRRWLVRRADLDAYILKHGRAAEPAAPSTETAGETDEADVRALLAECGVVAAAPEPRAQKSPRPNAARPAR